jgi:hypothetical protein
MRLAIRDQPVKRTIDSLRGQNRLVAQLVDQFVSAHRLTAHAPQRLDDHIVLLSCRAALSSLFNHHEALVVYWSRSGRVPILQQPPAIKVLRPDRWDFGPIAKPLIRRYNPANSSKRHETPPGTLGGRTRELRAASAPFFIGEL